MNNVGIDISPDEGFERALVSTPDSRCSKQCWQEVRFTWITSEMSLELYQITEQGVSMQNLTSQVNILWMVGRAL